jgi:hypothetical protein
MLDFLGGLRGRGGSEKSPEASGCPWNWLIYLHVGKRSSNNFAIVPLINPRERF